MGAENRRDWPYGDGEMAGHIRAYPWAATALGARDGWPASLRTVIDLILVLPDPATVLCGPARIQLYNDAYIAVARERHPALLGQPVAGGWPDVYEAVIAPLLAESDTGRSVRLTDFPVLLRGPGGEPEPRIFNTTWSPIRDADSSVMGALQILTEVTDGHRAQAALQASEARLRAAFESVPVGVAVLDTAGRIVIANTEYQRFLPSGIMPSRDPERGWRWKAWDPRGQPIEPTDFPGARAMRGESVVPGQEMLHTADDGREIWTCVAAVPIRDADGQVTGQSSVISDIDTLKRSSEKLRTSEERLRQFGEASSDVLWMRDARTLQWIYLTPAFETVFGLDRATALRDDNMTGWLELIVPEDRPTALANIERVRRGERAAFEYRIRRPSDGAVRMVRDTDFPMRDTAGQVRWLGGVGRDITEEKAAARRQEVLVNELQHRARNLLGSVTAIADRPLGQGGSVDAFQRRLQALSRVQGLLSRSGSDTVEVGALVRAELAAYIDGAADRICVVGPEVSLRSRQVQNFALALHELTTNAVKYGALQNGSGRLSVAWEAGTDQRGRRRLVLSWTEAGVMVDPDTVGRQGYGTELIQEALAYALEAEVDYALREDGVRCRIAMPIP